MPAYLIATIKVTNPEGYKAYVAAVPPTIAKFGGRYHVRGGNPQFLEGKWDQDRIVVLEFKDKATALAWYNSPEYQAIIPIRQANSTGALTIVDGYGG